ncbi:MAG: hypothetical protein R3F62_01120 [Planctomycetota bacterium]
MAKKPLIPRTVIERERRLLSAALREALSPAPPRKRELALRKVSVSVRRTWVSAGCFGEAVQWRLSSRPKDRGP